MLSIDDYVRAQCHAEKIKQGKDEFLTDLENKRKRTVSTKYSKEEFELNGQPEPKKKARQSKESSLDSSSYTPRNLPSPPRSGKYCSMLSKLCSPPERLISFD